MDGILRTFDLFMAYSPGYFVVDIVARDLAGHNDTAIVGIYILRDDQRVKIVINEIPDRVRGFEEEFIGLLSNITGAIVNTDDVQVPRGTALGLAAVRGGRPGHRDRASRRDEGSERGLCRLSHSLSNVALGLSPSASLALSITTCKMGLVTVPGPMR